MSDLRKELIRKLFHLFQVGVLIGYTMISHYFSTQIAVLALTAMLLILLEIEYIRVDYETRIGTRITEFFSRLFILRRHERKNITGAIFFNISTIIAFAAFDYRIAVLALLLTVFGDLAAAIMGIAFGKKKIFRNKTYVGTFSGLFVNIVTGAFVLTGAPQIFIPMALTASIVETLTQKLDDNLTVPLFAGFVGQLIVFAVNSGSV